MSQMEMPDIIIRNINHLPNEMLLYIFSYLSVEDIIFSVSHVSLLWNELSQDLTLWNKIKFVCNKIMTFEHIFSVISCSPNLKSIELQWRTDVNEIVDILCLECKNLLTLKIVCCGHIKSESFKKLTDSFPKLISLSLEKSWCYQSECCSFIPKFTCLKILNLDHCQVLSKDWLKEIIESCCMLAKINIDHIRDIDDDDMIHLINKKKNIIQSLIICGTNMTDTTFSLLRFCRNLSELHISRCNNMTDYGLQSLSQLKKLTSLKIKFGKNLSTQGWLTFLSNSCIYNLNYLCVSQSMNFDDSCAECVASNCPKLTVFVAYNCPQLTNYGRIRIWKSCKECNRLIY